MIRISHLAAIALTFAGIAAAQTPTENASKNPSSESARQPSSSSTSPANSAMNKQAKEKRSLTDCVAGEVASNKGLSQEAAMRTCKARGMTGESQQSAPSEKAPAR